MVQPWFERLRGCGTDIRELVHDGHLIACVEDAAFAYVDAFRAHANVGFFHAAENTAPSLHIELAALAVHTGSEIEQRITKFAAEPDGGLIIAPHAVTVSSRELIASLALRYRLPAVYSDRYFAESGGLISFGNNTADLFRRAASYIDRILKGAKPVDLPVQLPTKFETVINLKTAKLLGITMPAFLLQNADDVIE